MSFSPLLRSAYAFDGSKWRPLTALRCAVGVAIPIVLGSLSGHTAWGILASIGALNAGLASFSGVYRSRLRLMLGASAVMSAATILALLVSPSALLTALMLLLLSYGLALYGASGPSANVIALQGTMVFIILSGLGLPPSLALPGGLLVLLGGLLQTLLLGLIWPINPHHPERRAAAQVYRRLEEALRSLPQQGDVLLSPLEFEEAWTLLEQARRLAWRPEHGQVRQALRVAEGLRAALVGYSRADWAFRAYGPAAAAQAEHISQVLLAALREVESQLARGASLELSSESRSALQAAIRALALPTAEPALSQNELPLAAWASLMERSLLNLGSPEQGNEPPVPDAPSQGPPVELTWLDRWRNGWTSRAAWQTATGRHAFKYAAALSLCSLAVHWLKVPHGYWLVLTVGVVLRQDYVTTMTRGLARFGGTLAGVLLASLLVWAARPSPEMLGLLSLGAAWLTYALFPSSYAAFSGAITLYVVFSVTASGLAESLVSEQRALMTLLGGLLAAALFLLWPNWQAGQLRAALQRAADAQQRYIAAVAELQRGPPSALKVEAARSARAEARALRIQAEQVVRSAHLEPNRSRAARTLPLPEADAALLQLHANAALSLSLHARSLHPVSTDSLPDQRPQMEQELTAAAQTAEQLGRQLGGAA